MKNALNHFEIGFIIGFIILLALIFFVKRKIAKIEKEIILTSDCSIGKEIFDDIAHELKTPIAVILGNIELLKSSAEIMSSEKYLIHNEIEMAGHRLKSYLQSLEKPRL